LIIKEFERICSMWVDTLKNKAEIKGDIVSIIDEKWDAQV
jgi:hypothetical protein